MQTESTENIFRASPNQPAANDRKWQLLELLVFLSLIVPSMVESFFLVGKGTGSGGTGFDMIAWATIIRDITLVALIAFFLWRNRESMVLVGWNLRGSMREVALGIVLFFPMLIITTNLDQLLKSHGLSGPPRAPSTFLTPSGRLEFALAVLLVIVVAVAEETIFRGYLIRRLKAVTRSTFAAVVLSSVIFSVGHGYEGTAGVVTVGVIGAILAVVYLWRGTLVAPITMHFLQDFVAIVALPWLAHVH